MVRNWIPSVAEGTRGMGFRLVRWGFLAGALLVLVVIFGLCVPYCCATQYIDRRTGIWYGDLAYFGIRVEHDRRVAMPVRGNPMGKVPLTAPERRILVRAITKRFFWSQSVVVYDETGVQYAEAFSQMFHFASWERPKARKLSDDELDRIVKERSPFWNSGELDKDPHMIAEAARQENADLLGVPVERVFRP